ncbi:hypothetical protein GCM10022275_22830 [Tessaracoccus defluvii]
MFRTIFAHPPATPSQPPGTRSATSSARYPKLGPHMDLAKAEALAFTGFPRLHRTKIWSTNPSSG